MISRKFLLVFVLVSLFSVSALVAAEAPVEEVTTQTGNGYLLGDKVILVDMGVFFAGPIHFWGALTKEMLEGGEDVLGDDAAADFGLFVNLLYTMASTLTGLNIGVSASAMYPLYTMPSDDGSVTEFHLGAEVAPALSLGGLHLSLRAAGRIGFTSLDDEGNRNSYYIRPFIGYMLRTRDLPGHMKKTWEEYGNPIHEDGENIEEDAGHYLDLGFRFGQSIENDGGMYFDIGFPIPIGGDALPHLKLTIIGLEMLLLNL